MYHNFRFLEVLFFTISLVVYFPFYLKRIVSCFIFSEYYKAQNVNSLLEKDDFSSACIINLDTSVSSKHERRDDCCITIPKDYQSHSGHKGDDSSSLDDNIFPHKKLIVFQFKNKEIFKPPEAARQLPSISFKRIQVLAKFLREGEGPFS